MSRVSIAAALLFGIVASTAHAQSAPDPRLAPIETAALKTLIGQLAEGAAQVTAQLAVEKADHAATQQELKNLQDWVRGYFGE